VSERGAQIPERVPGCAEGSGCQTSAPSLVVSERGAQILERGRAESSQTIREGRDPGESSGTVGNPELSDRIYRTSVPGVRKWLGFPNPVNETSARLVAGGVVAQCAAFLVVTQWWILVVLAYGFLARVLTGPRFSPLGQLVTRVITPRIHAEHRFVPGPPKRFAQGMGLVFSGGALLAWGLGAHVVTYVLIGGLLMAATLESVFALCLGCVVFNRLMRWGLIPADVCEECNDVRRELARASS
jgi:uncharacterized protein DUF4395